MLEASRFARFKLIFKLVFNLFVWMSYVPLQYLNNV